MVISGSVSGQGRWVGPEDAGDSRPRDRKSRTLTLDWTKTRKYQTKFYLGPAHPFAKVPPDAALEDLQQALLTGLLIDVSDQHIKGVSDANGNHLSPVGVSDDPDARMVFIGSEKHEGLVSGPKPLFPWQSLKTKDRIGLSVLCLSFLFLSPRWPLRRRFGKTTRSSTSDPCPAEIKASLMGSIIGATW